MKNADEILELAEVIKAARAGAIVETKYPEEGDDKWDAMSNPSFTSEKLQYRIKPKPPTYEHHNIYNEGDKNGYAYKASVVIHSSAHAAERARTNVTGVVDTRYIGTLVVEVK